LRRWREAQRLERMVAGGEWRGGDIDACLVLTDIDGSAVTPSSIRRRHDALLRAAGVPGYLMHEARHTAVSQRARYEQMHVVSRIVGHASPAYTASAYWHAQTGHDRSSVDALAEELRRRRES
jgi:integrase